MSNAHPGDDALVAHALDELESRGRPAIEAHLEGCESCRGMVNRLRAALDVYRTAEPAEAPARVLADLLEVQAEQRAGRLDLTPRLRPAFVTAGLVVLAGIFASGFWMGRSTAPATGAPAVSMEARKEGSPPPHPLPERPAIEFRTEPPLDARFALAAEANFAGARARHDGRRDSL